MGCQLIKTLTVKGKTVSVFGCWDEETPEGTFDFYDFYVDGECINEGEPHYDKELNLIDAIEACLELKEELRKY